MVFYPGMVTHWPRRAGADDSLPHRSRRARGPCPATARQGASGLCVESAGSIVPGMSIEPLSRHPFHEVRQQRLAPCRKPPRPLVEQGPASELFFKVREIRERRNHFFRRLGQKQRVERLNIMANEYGPALPGRIFRQHPGTENPAVTNIEWASPCEHTQLLDAASHPPHGLCQAGNLKRTGIRDPEFPDSSFCESLIFAGDFRRVRRPAEPARQSIVVWRVELL
jgi:hypothetical protein